VIRRPVWFALVSALAAAPAGAQEPAPQPAASTAPAGAPSGSGVYGLQPGGLRIETTPTRAAVQIADPAVEQALTLTNQGPDALLDLGPLASGRAELATDWRAANGVAVKGPVPLARGASLALTLSATAGQAGVYRSRIRLLDPIDRHELWAGYFALERRAALPDAGVLVAPGAPFERNVGLWFEAAPVTFTVHNPSGEALTLQPPQLLELRRETGGRTRSVFLGAVTGRYECPEAPKAGQMMVLEPDASCRGVVMASINGAGAYTARVAVNGLDGGQAAGDVQVNIRLSWLWAALVTAIGSLCGWLVGSFRRDWRARSLLEEAATLQRERLLRLDRRARTIGQGEVTAPTLHALDGLIQRIRTQSDLAGLAEQVSTLGQRIERLDRWQSLEAHIVGTPAEDLTKSSRAALRVALCDPATPDAELTPLFAAVTDASAGAMSATQTLAAVASGALPSAAPPPSGQDSPLISLRTSDAAALIATRRKHIELVVNGVAGLALVASAVQAVWANDPTWGDLSDVLGLLITAFAVQAGGSVALGQWTGASRSNTAPVGPQVG
jgi:hypothetical protein